VDEGIYHDRDEWEQLVQWIHAARINLHRSADRIDQRYDGHSFATWLRELAAQCPLPWDAADSQ